MKPCTRIEIVAESALTNALLELFQEVDIPGFTMIPDIRGSGRT